MNVIYNLYNVTDVHKIEIHGVVHKNIEGKMSSYLKSLPEHSLQRLTVKIERNKKNRYVGSFILELNGKQYVYKTTTDGFRVVSDLVSHAFDRFKERLVH